MIKDDDDDDKGGDDKGWGWRWIMRIIKDEDDKG